MSGAIDPSTLQPGGPLRPPIAGFRRTPVRPVSAWETGKLRRIRPVVGGDVGFARVPSGTSALSKSSDAAVETRAPKMIARVLRGDGAAMARGWDAPRRDARDEAEAETRAGELRSTGPGFDFSRVRTHADGEADALAGDLGAAAFT